MVKRRLLLRLSGAGLLAAALAIPVSAPAAGAAILVSDPASVVNPFIGTSNQANDFPGADVPFGMVQWSPDTPSRPSGGGYEYNDSSITGFSLTHLSGPGCGADGDVPILPTVGAVDGGASDSFSHANESANAGYYSVGLDNGVKTELTAALRSGMARFTFPSSTQSNLVFKLNGSQNGTSDQTWNVVSPTEVSGSVTSGHFCGAGFTYTLYFDRPFAGSGNAAVPAVKPKASPGKLPGKAAPAAAQAPAAGPTGSYVQFDTTSNPTVQAQVGLSYVSVANAAANRAADLPSFDFAGTQRAAHDSWNSMLGRIQVAGGSDSQQQVFYTALYHSLLHPNVFSDSNGQYIGFDNQVHTVASGHSAQYANFSGWDIYRTQAQLSALIAPAQTSDIAQSMIADYDQSGALPKWAQNNGETYIMVGDPAAPILADYYAFGARGFDTSAALAAMVHEASEPNNDRPWSPALNSPGYIPANADTAFECCAPHGPVSTQLEYDTADFAVSAFAGALGDKADQDFYAGRAQNWRNVFNSGSGLMQPKDSDGSWTGGFDPKSQTDFVEGTSWQYTGMVPFNVAGLANARGGNSSLVSYLDSVLSGFHYGDGSQSDLGNEPSLELPWEYDYVGQPYKTQSVVRQVQDQIWTDAPGGLAGNDDLGAMSAWYVFSALGFYPMTPGTADLALGSPLFTQAVITLPTGKTLTISAPKAADNAPYVQSATWNGGAWDNAYAPTSAITDGGTLAFDLGTSANTGWAASSPPPSYDGTLPHTDRLVSGIPGKCADVDHSKTASGTKVQLYTCNPSGAQQWFAAPDGSLQAEGGCLDVINSGTAEDTLVQRWHCNDSAAQMWQPGPNGSLVNPNSGRCLDDPESTTTDGTQLRIHTCNGTPAQSWTHG